MQPLWEARSSGGAGAAFLGDWGWVLGLLGLRSGAIGAAFWGLGLRSWGTGAAFLGGAGAAF